MVAKTYRKKQQVKPRHRTQKNTFKATAIDKPGFKMPPTGASTVNDPERVNLGRENPNISLIVKTLLEILTTVKIYHWNTLSYAQHKATDQLYDELNDSIDTFVEILLGKNGRRIDKMASVCRQYDFKRTGNDKDDTKGVINRSGPPSGSLEPDTTMFKQKIFEYRHFLTELNRVFSAKKDSDLLNIRDEILGQLNQFLYLLSFT